MPKRKKSTRKSARSTTKRRRSKKALVKPVEGVADIAETMAGKQREISVSEFFTKNRHLLGFDNPRKALLTTIKEGVDNSLDACEEARILPEILVQVDSIEGRDDRFVVSLEDNGPGIVRKQIPAIFAKLLYGSKFHRLRQGRGQQGIGISAAGMYGQLTTGKPIRIISKTKSGKTAHAFELMLDTKKNEPRILKDEEFDWKEKSHGTRVEIEMEAKFQKGRQSVDEYLAETAIANPHARIEYLNPIGEKTLFERGAKDLPQEAREIKPHPHGVELGMLLRMLHDSGARKLSSFLRDDFSRVSLKVAGEICKAAGLGRSEKPRLLTVEQADKLITGIHKTKIMSPPTDCLSPIGEELILKGLSKEITAEFYGSVTRPPAVYRGNPFQIEAGIAFGGKLSDEEAKNDEPVKILRYANRVPLLYQQSACAVTKSVIGTAWKNYGLSQSRGGIPSGPAVIFVHIASVWVPFTSESKEAIAHYPEIVKEIKLALQELGRRLQAFLRKRDRAAYEIKRRSIFELYIEELGECAAQLTKLNKTELKKNLTKIAEKITKKEKLEQQSGPVISSNRKSKKNRVETLELEPENDLEQAG